MGTSVDANGRSVLHKGHGMTHTCAVPDVCKTPSPAGPVPIPYVNIAMDSNLADGASTVKIEGNPVAKVTSKISMSTGDEPGTAGGVISSKFKGAMTWKMGSLDVKAEGKSVVRFLDTAFHNGNTFNSSFINVGGTGFAYGDDAPCPACGEPAEKHRVHETDEVRTCAARLLKRLQELLDAERSTLRDALRARETMRLLNREMKSIKRDLGGAGFAAALAAETAKLAAANGSLAGTHVLVMDAATDTYTQGYMIGICLCRCGQKALASCSGNPTPGFRRAVADAGFTLGPDMPALSTRQASNVASVGKGPTWACAAPKLINALAGHKPRTLVEQFYQPADAVVAVYEWTSRTGEARKRQENAAFPRSGKEGVKVKYRRTVDDVETEVEEVFGSGDTAPSCDRCKVNLPEMLCKSDEKCPGQS